MAGESPGGMIKSRHEKSELEWIIFNHSGPFWLALVNMLGAIILLPALAAWLYRLNSGGETRA